MIQRLCPLITISLTILALVKSYDFNTKSCAATVGQQSPINLDISQSLYFDEKYFRFLSNNYNPLTTDNFWQYFDEERAIGIAPTKNQTNFGSFIFVKDWAMYNFNLQKVLFRLGSEHQINGQTFDVEMQLIHTIDTNYYAPGRRINLGVSNLVISIFFQKIEDGNPARTRLFDFMNLAGFVSGNTTNINMNRNIKLHYMVQHQPSLLYKGSLSYPECEPAIWLAFTQYHFISAFDLAQLTLAIQSKVSYLDTTSKKNTRNVFSVAPGTQVFRNWNDVTQLSPKPNLLAYSSSSYINFSCVTLMSLIFLFAMIFF
jgi:carbonic anhydrase